MVANNLYAAEKIYNFLLNFLDEEDLVFFPSDELLRAENLSSGRELLAQRLYALGRLQEEKRKKILIVHPASLLRFLPSPERFKSDTLFLKKGKAQGARTRNGMEMLYGQAKAAWKIWNNE